MTNREMNWTTILNLDQLDKTAVSELFSSPYLLQFSEEKEGWQRWRPAHSTGQSWKIDFTISKAVNCSYLEQRIQFLLQRWVERSHQCTQAVLWSIWIFEDNNNHQLLRPASHGWHPDGSSLQNTIVHCIANALNLKRAYLENRITRYITFIKERTWLG